MEIPSEKELSRFVGIDFHHGSTDCYGLIRLFYREIFGIELTNYARPDNWWDNGYNLYMDYFERENFRIIDEDLQKNWKFGDIILMAIQSEVPCHGAIYLGDGRILHHFYGRKSCIENYCRIWKNTTTGILRHKDVRIENKYKKMELIEDERVRTFMFLQQQRSRERGNSN